MAVCGGGVSGGRRAHVILSNLRSVYQNLALENWILTNWQFSNTDCLLVYRNRPCVVVGRFQNPWRELDVRRANEQGIDIARRVSGGGTVYHDLGNVNFSFFTDKPSHCPARNLTFLSDTLNRWRGFGLETNERHDMSIGGAKVTGSASRIIRTGSFHHCTLLVTSSLSSLSSVLHGDDQISSSIATASLPSAVTNLAEHADDVISPPHVVSHVTDAYLARYGCLFPEEQEPWSPDQAGVADLMVVDKLPAEVANPEHSTWEWVFGKTPKFRRDFAGGVSVVVDKGVVQEVLGGTQQLQGLVGQRYDQHAIEHSIANRF